jgi:hypothetical protein
MVQCAFKSHTRKRALILRRDEAYIGVLIDDLIVLRVQKSLIECLHERKLQNVVGIMPISDS